MDSQTPCIAGCGFYSSPITKNYCSKCFKDLGITEDTKLKNNDTVNKIIDKTISFSNTIEQTNKNTISDTQ